SQPKTDWYKAFHTDFVNGFMPRMVTPMYIKLKKLGITQLFLSLFSPSLTGIQGTFPNSRSIPPTTNRSTDIVGVSWRF
ncbi:MAG: hypothetical protein ACRC62_25175, partial [Microcoleus sp.]